MRLLGIQIVLKQGTKMLNQESMSLSVTVWVVAVWFGATLQKCRTDPSCVEVLYEQP
jgi:hypothetical protein